MTNIAETPLIHPPFYCIIRADDPVKLESALNIMETTDPGMDHRVCDLPFDSRRKGRLGKDVIAIFGMGDITLEVIRHKLKHEHGVSFDLLKEVGVTVLEPWISFEIDYPSHQEEGVKDELKDRRSILRDDVVSLKPHHVMSIGSMPARMSIGLFDKLRKITSGTASTSTDFCEYRVAFDWSYEPKQIGE